MKRITIIAAAGAVLLAGCSGGETDADGDGAISASEVAAKAQAGGIKPQPGLYKSTVVMTGIDIPGMPAGMEGHGAGQTITTEDCLTQAEVDKGFEELFKQGQNGECSYERFDLAGGELDAVMVCKTPDGEARMTMTGTTTATTAEFTAESTMNFEGVGEAKLNFTGTHERIGECPAN
ncbi:MAG: DUF3617 domain-containing protein [Sphingomonadales bacterium]|nr:DUF3617 domain-containing protein [Sphingomonadales bacterium]NCQ20356.1 DUF3617 domain-containing protein [Sphingomonadales bacterium]NCT02785.1 DUF3617 domain-containing protein [Sphingomonadales bacterium]